MNKMIKKIFAFAILCMAFIYVSCSSELDSLEEKKTGTVTFSVKTNEKSARTILPYFDESYFGNITLIVKDTSDNILESHHFNSISDFKNFKIELMPGFYKFDLNTFYDYGRLFTGQATANIVAGETNTVTIPVKMTSENENTDTGELWLNVHLDNVNLTPRNDVRFEGTIYQITNTSENDIYFDSNDGSFCVLRKNAVGPIGEFQPNFPIELQSGDYYLEIIFTDVDSSEIAIIKEYLSMTKNAYISKDYDLNDSDFEYPCFITYHYDAPGPNGMPLECEENPFFWNDDKEKYEHDFTYSYLPSEGYILNNDFNNEEYNFSITWYEDSTCTIPAEDGLVGVTTGNKEFWAKWEARSNYTVNLKLGENEVPVELEYPYYLVDVDECEFYLGKAPENHFYAYYSDENFENLIRFPYYLTEDNSTVYVKCYENECHYTEEQYFKAESVPEGIKITYYYSDVEHKAGYSNLRFTEKETGITVDMTTVGNKNFVEYSYPFTQAGKEYTFTCTKQCNSNGEYLERDVTCRAGGGDDSMFNFTEEYYNAQLKFSSTSLSVQLTDDVLSAFFDEDAFEDISPCINVFAGDTWWATPTEWIVWVGFWDSEYTTLLTGCDLTNKLSATARKALSNHPTWFGSFTVQFRVPGYDYLFKTRSIDSAQHGFENDCILYKQDIQLCTITFETNGGNTIEPLIIEKGDNLYVDNEGRTHDSAGINWTDVPEKGGYQFDNWYSTPDFTPESVYSRFTGNGNPINENVTLYAKWVEYN